MLAVIARMWAWVGARARPARPAARRRDPLGPAGERVARRYLRRRGYRLMGRNVRVPVGEADLVFLAPDRRTVVVVEVKTRRVAGPTSPAAAAPSTLSAATFIQPPPEASVDAAKRRKLLAVTRYLAKANRWHARPVRIDVVAVEWPHTGNPTLRHHEGAVVAGRR